MEYHCERQARLKPANLGSSSPLASCSCNDALFTLHDLPLFHTFHFTRSHCFTLYTISHCFTLFSIFKFSVGWQAAAAAGHQVAHERREQRWKNLAPTHYGRGWETIVAFFIHRRRDDRCIGAFFITCIASNVPLFFRSLTEICLEG